jgi:hypothetical protein
MTQVSDVAPRSLIITRFKTTKDVVYANFTSHILDTICVHLFTTNSEINENTEDLL